VEKQETKTRSDDLVLVLAQRVLKYKKSLMSSPKLNEWPGKIEKLIRSNLLLAEDGYLNLIYKSMVYRS